MFKKNCLITRGIDESLDVRIISALWKKLVTAEEKLDYLQIFELSNENGNVKVVWKQEEPERKTTFFIENVSTDIPKVWVICEGENTEDEYSTMLLPEEY